jgi:membrane-bound lytic murein transglycosylase D
MTRGREEGRKGGSGKADWGHASSHRIHFCALVLTVFLLLSLSNVFAQSNTPQTNQANMILQKRLGVMEKRVVDLEKETANLRSEIENLRFPSPPETLTLCDKPIPLGRDDVRERFDREFYQILENRGLLTILAKRHSKFLSAISDNIEKFGVPPDLIYLAIAESYLNPRDLSSAGAGGMWQFIKETGKREGLFINEIVDERYSIPLSTYSALNHLRKLYAEFGDWFLAMASYNCGAGKVREAIANQNTRDFFDLFLPEETERYIMRIAAFKELIANHRKYGLDLDNKSYYKPYSVCDLILTVTKDVHTAVLAQASDLPYKAFRDLNLHLRRYTLSKGSYHIFVPSEKRETFLRRIRGVPDVLVEKDG